MEYAIFKRTHRGRPYYNESTNGYECIGWTDNQQAFYNKVKELEDIDFFEQEDGSVLDQQQNEVYNPNFPNFFDFGGTEYYLEEVKLLNKEFIADRNMLLAIEKYAKDLENS